MPSKDLLDIAVSRGEPARARILYWEMVIFKSTTFWR